MMQRTYLGLMPSKCLTAQCLSIVSTQTSNSKTLSKASRHSSILSLSAKHVAAKVAATQEVIKIMNEQHQQEEKIQQLEAEDQILKAEREAEENELEAEY